MRHVVDDVESRYSSTTSPHPSFEVPTSVAVMALSSHHVAMSMAQQRPAISMMLTSSQQSHASSGRGGGASQPSVLTVPDAQLGGATVAQQQPLAQLARVVGECSYMDVQQGVVQSIRSLHANTAQTSQSDATRQSAARPRDDVVTLDYSRAQQAGAQRDQQQARQASCLLVDQHPAAVRPADIPLDRRRAQPDHDSARPLPSHEQAPKRQRRTSYSSRERRTQPYSVNRQTSQTSSHRSSSSENVHNIPSPLQHMHAAFPTQQQQQQEGFLPPYQPAAYQQPPLAHSTTRNNTLTSAAPVTHSQVAGFHDHLVERLGYRNQAAGYSGHRSPADNEQALDLSTARHRHYDVSSRDDAVGRRSQASNVSADGYGIANMQLSTSASQHAFGDVMADGDNDEDGSRVPPHVLAVERDVSSASTSSDVSGGDARRRQVSRRSSGYSSRPPGSVLN